MISKYKPVLREVPHGCSPKFCHLQGSKHTYSNAPDCGDREMWEVGFLSNLPGDRKKGPLLFAGSVVGGALLGFVTSGGNPLGAAAGAIASAAAVEAARQRGDAPAVLVFGGGSCPLPSRI